MIKSELVYKENIERFQALLKLYSDYNSHTNISALRDEDDIVEKHFMDSLEILNHMDFSDGLKILDLGAGGGFPVLPLAIVLPGVEFYALDATAKKTKFISQVKESLSLNNLTVLTGRAEDFAHQKEYREDFDFVMARAVAQLNILLELSTAFIKKDGALLSYKSFPIEQEEHESQKAQKELMLNFKERKKVSEDRQILVFSKNDSVSGQYPREFAKIKKATL